MPNIGKISTLKVKRADTSETFVAVYQTKWHSFLNTFVSDSLTHEIRPVLQPSLHIVNVMRQDSFSCTRAWKQFLMTVLSEPVTTRSPAISLCQTAPSYRLNGAISCLLLQDRSNREISVVLCRNLKDYLGF